jgi:hypothetical protein
MFRGTGVYFAERPSRSSGSTLAERRTGPSKIDFAKFVFSKTYPQISETKLSLAGVVIVFDSEDGGMVAATTATLQQWNAGHLSDTPFWKQC